MELNLEDIKKRLLELGEYDDTEEAHIEADNIIIQMITDLGYEDIAELYDKIYKWYA